MNASRVLSHPTGDYEMEVSQFMEQSIPDFKLALVAIEGERRIDSREIAINIKVQHESLMKTIKAYQGRLEKYGRLRFEIGVKQGAQRGIMPQYALLNREQFGYLLMFVKVTDIVCAFREFVYDVFLETISKEQAAPPPPPERPFKVFTEEFCDRTALNEGRVDRGFFGIQEAIASKLYRLQACNKDLEADDYLEISIGKDWSTHVTDVWHLPYKQRPKYDHILPSGTIVEACMYSTNLLRDEFDWWFDNIYMKGEGYQNYLRYFVKKRAKAAKQAIDTPKTKRIKKSKGA